nr:hypothetical protein [Micromonospora sp. DSM 115978]
MRDEPTTPDPGNPDPRPDTPLTPQQRAAAIRAAAVEVLTRVQEWRDAPGWAGTPANQRRYQITATAVAQLDNAPEPDPDRDDALMPLVDAVRPILTEWRTNRPGAEQAIFAAVERLRTAINR